MEKMSFVSCVRSKFLTHGAKGDDDKIQDSQAAVTVLVYTLAK